MRSTHSDARTLAVIAKADAAGPLFALNDRAKWILHHIALHPSATHLDDDSAALFSRSLEQQLTLVLEQPRPELPLAGGDELLPNFSLDQGATTFRFFLQDSQGEWRYGAGGGGENIPTASISGAEMTGKLQIAYGAFGYTREDLRNWSFASRGALPTMLQSASLRGKVQLHDETLAWGKESLGLYGLLNFPHSTILTAADNGLGSTDWEDKSIDQVTADIRALLRSSKDATNLMRSATMVLMSERMEDFLRTRRIVDTTTGGTTTYWEYIQKVFVSGGSVPNGPPLPPPTNPVQFRWVRYLDGRNEQSEKDGVPQLPVVSGNRTDGMFAYIHNNPEVVAKAVTPLSGNFLPPQIQGVTIQSTGEAKWGGIRCPEPVTLAMMHGCFGNPA